VEAVEPEPLDQVNEAEEEAEVEEVIMNDIADIQQGAQEATQEVEVIMPDQYVPLMPLEILEEDRMNNAEIQEQAVMAANQLANIFIGRI
jgi:2-phospho-L-lactate guanylyltransferase (CobY/MobA/RfbA family)